MEQKQYRTRTTPTKTLSRTICFSCLVFTIIDCYLFAIHLINKDFMVGVIIICMIALMTGLTVSSKISK
jgi:hypothetical protein